MERLDSVVILSILIFGMLILLALFMFFYEKKKKKEIKKKFKTFSKNYQMSNTDLRAVSRISIPDEMEVVLTLTDDSYIELKAFALDISLTGFGVEPHFPLKRLPLHGVLKNVQVNTPINSFTLREMKLVRKEQRTEKKFMAFTISDINEDQFEELKFFIRYLDKFLTHGH